jgi:AraC-like DNA-binding protein
MRHPVEHNRRCRFHSHHYVEIVYHPAGRGWTELATGHRIDFQEGDVVVYAQEESHNQSMTHEGEDWCVYIALPGNGKQLPHGAFHVPRVADALVIEEIRALSQGQPAKDQNPYTAEQAILDLRATALLLALVRSATQKREQDEATPARRYAFRAENCLRERFASVDSLQEVAKEVGIGIDHLRHAFRAEFGTGMAAYLNGVRIERARMLLANSILPLKQIATICGFRDEYYFSTVFRRATGTSPGQYRTANAMIERRARSTH